MVISSASPKTDSQRAMDLLASITDKDALQKTLADLDARTKAAETAEAKARNAVSEAQKHARTLQAKETELQAREADVVAQKAKLDADRSSFMQMKSAEDARLSKLSDELNSRGVQIETEHAERMKNHMLNFAQKEADLKGRSAQVENLAKGLDAREKSVADREAKAEALVAEYRDKIAALKGIVNG